MKQIVVCILLVLSTHICVCQTPFIFSVKGPIETEKLGFALPHEHVMSNFGADFEIADHYDNEAVLNQVIPYLNKLKSLGVHSIFDGTAAYFGRNPVLLERISTQTGIHIITNTGFYGAADDRYVPSFAFNTSVYSIANLWIDEFKNGIDGTEIRPGFIKLAFDRGRPSKIDLKLFEAGVLTHLETGLTLAVHTGNNLKAIRRQFALLKKHGVSPTALIWIHAINRTTTASC